jgi:hypothetical protein
VTLSEIAVSADAMTTAELEAEKHARDEQIAAIRREMAVIHALLEPRWHKQMLDRLGPEHLRQEMKPGISLR